MTTAIRLITEPGAQPADIIDAVKDYETRGTRYIILADDQETGFDAVQLAAFLAPHTTSAVLVPEVPLTHTEPFHVATATATLDFAAAGRTAWSPSVQTSANAAALTGRREAADAEETWREAGEIDELLNRLWLSWEPDAIIRDVETSRFLDASKVHYADFTGTDSVGVEFTVYGSSIVPRSPQGELPTLVRVVDEPSARFAAARAEIVEFAAEVPAELIAQVRAGAQARAVELVELDAVPELRFGAARESGEVSEPGEGQ